MWKRELGGRIFTFYLAGINNQNFLMRDNETGSYWQQISGKAVAGPMRGQQLELVQSDELTFALWKKENPNGEVLRPVPAYEAKYEGKDWEARLAKLPTVVNTSHTGVGGRELVIGVARNGESRAYPMSRILDLKLIQDIVGGGQVLLVVGPDQTSVRVFATRAMEDFYRKPDGTLIDAATGSEWNFKGCAVAGSAQGTCLQALPAIKDYWFDWLEYHRSSTVFKR